MASPCTGERGVNPIPGSTDPKIGKYFAGVPNQFAGLMDVRDLGNSSYTYSITGQLAAMYDRCDASPTSRKLEEDTTATNTTSKPVMCGMAQNDGYDIDGNDYDDGRQDVIVVDSTGKPVEANAPIDAYVSDEDEKRVINWYDQTMDAMGGDSHENMPAAQEFALWLYLGSKLDHHGSSITAAAAQPEYRAEPLDTDTWPSAMSTAELLSSSRKTFATIPDEDAVDSDESPTNTTPLDPSCYERNLHAPPVAALDVLPSRTSPLLLGPSPLRRTDVHAPSDITTAPPVAPTQSAKATSSEMRAPDTRTDPQVLASARPDRDSTSRTGFAISDSVPLLTDLTPTRPGLASATDERRKRRASKQHCFSMKILLILSVALFALLVRLSNVEAQAPATCGPRIRKDWDMLTPVEKDTYKNAIAAAMDSGDYIKFVEMHTEMRSEMEAHRQCMFT
ncbi:hypothetical protein PHYSODRAFT_340367 [Phytophthora sojae]|uniref:Uncharacterized protein n=1 Tax=Phytophthora sojae (strain P6497) TaxID=1094619 RepID=G5AB95_PHYSP|nr:hypothetical protein PHYSODRAFT_340367 [Phytophthora sojae]EGZ07240.1 hypothetical protein PHYSODRAFT_340367 [Phytophthora sojae]|eukprot:XP_009536806.1 hypothetical protein PHYSODRAFT_340367 [Phytophthora sojae]